MKTLTQTTAVKTTQLVSTKLFINIFSYLNFKTKEKMDVQLSITTYKINNGKEKNELVLSAEMAMEFHKSEKLKEWLQECEDFPPAASGSYDYDRSWGIRTTPIQP